LIFVLQETVLLLSSTNTLSLTLHLHPLALSLAPVGVGPLVHPTHWGPRFRTAAATPCLFLDTRGYNRTRCYDTLYFIFHALLVWTTVTIILLARALSLTLRDHSLTRGQTRVSVILPVLSTHWGQLERAFANWFNTTRTLSITLRDHSLTCGQTRVGVLLPILSTHWGQLTCAIARLRLFNTRTPSLTLRDDSFTSGQTLVGVLLPILSTHWEVLACAQAWWLFITRTLPLALHFDPLAARRTPVAVVLAVHPAHWCKLLGAEAGGWDYTTGGHGEGDSQQQLFGKELHLYHDN